MTIDILPTVAKLLGVTLDSTRKIDGLDISPLMFGVAGAKSPHDALYFYWGDGLHAVRSGRWKLHFPHAYRKLESPGSGGQPGPYAQGRTELALFDLTADPGETHDVQADHPEVVARLQKKAESARADLGDELQKRQGAGRRTVGKLRE